MVKFGIENKTKSKLLINIGALMDIPTGSYITGTKGESILNGGLGMVSGVVGAGNNFKSTIMHYMLLSAASRTLATNDTEILTYDTEVNISLDRLEDMSDHFEHIPKYPITAANLWTVTDKTLMDGEEWFNSVLKYTQAKASDKKSLVKYTAFKDPYSTARLETQVPTFIEIDSLSEFESESTMNMVDKSIEDSNTVFMKQGLFKSKVMKSLPRLTNRSNTYILLTAQVGEKINMASGPAMYNQPTKKLQHLKSGDAIKGVSGSFYFLLNNAWFAHTATVLKNQTTKLAEYPKDSNDTLEADLNIVKLSQMRSKTGTSGYTLNIVVSQTDGVLSDLTEFHHIKTNKFGFEGNDRFYALELYPDTKLSRTTVRSKMKEDPKLVRAINITSELLQLHKFHHYLKNIDLLCTPKELYDDIKSLGYDWDVLLDTRGWWAIDNYSSKLKPYLSIMDLLKMRKKLYKPYWLKGNKNG